MFTCVLVWSFLLVFFFSHIRGWFPNKSDDKTRDSDGQWPRAVFAILFGGRNSRPKFSSDRRKRQHIFVLFRQRRTIRVFPFKILTIVFHATSREGRVSEYRPTKLENIFRVELKILTFAALNLSGHFIVINIILLRLEALESHPGTILASSTAYRLVEIFRFFPPRDSKSNIMRFSRYCSEMNKCWKSTLKFISHYGFMNRTGNAVDARVKKYPTIYVAVPETWLPWSGSVRSLRENDKI